MRAPPRICRAYTGALPGGGDLPAMTTLTPSSVRNGIDTAQVYGTLDALKAQPELARFEFRATNRWINGTHSRATIHGFWGAGQEDSSRETPFVIDASEPP